MNTKTVFYSKAEVYHHTLPHCLVMIDHNTFTRTPKHAIPDLVRPCYHCTPENPENPENQMEHEKKLREWACMYRRITKRLSQRLTSELCLTTPVFCENFQYHRDSTCVCITNLSLITTLLLQEIITTMSHHPCWVCCYVTHANEPFRQSDLVTSWHACKKQKSGSGKKNSKANNN